MKKEYGIIFYKSRYLYGAIAFSIGTIFMLYLFLKLHTEIKQISFWPFFLLVLIEVPILVFAYLCWFYFPKEKVIIDNDKVSILKPDKSITVNIKDIYRIERELGWGTWSYYIFYKENNKKRVVYFTDAINGYQEIADYLEKKRPKYEIKTAKDIALNIGRLILKYIITFVALGIPILFLLFPELKRFLMGH